MPHPISTTETADPDTVVLNGLYGLLGAAETVETAELGREIAAVPRPWETAAPERVGLVSGCLCDFVSSDWDIDDLISNYGVRNPHVSPHRNPTSKLLNQDTRFVLAQVHGLTHFTSAGQIIGL